MLNYSCAQAKAQLVVLIRYDKIILDIYSI